MSSDEESRSENLRNELEKHIEHVRQHDPKTMMFSLSVHGHKNPDGSLHVCTMAGGEAKLLAKAIAEIIDTMADQSPEFMLSFALAMRDLALKNHDKAKACIKNAKDEADGKFDETGGKSEAEAINELLRSQGIPLPNGTKH